MLGRDEQIAYGDTVDWVKQQPWYSGNLVWRAHRTWRYPRYSRPKNGRTISMPFLPSVPMGDALRGTVGTGGMINGLFMHLAHPHAEVTSQKLLSGIP